MAEKEDGMTGVSPTGPGHSRAEHEEVSVVPTSVPNAWPLMGYAPGNYMGRCHVCGQTLDDVDKRAWQCLECAARHVKAAILDLRAQYDELLFAVARKYEGESRHQTALRYIREREEGASAMSAGTAETTQIGSGRKPASAVGTAETPNPFAGTTFETRAERASRETPQPPLQSEGKYPVNGCLDGK